MLALLKLVRRGATGAAVPLLMVLLSLLSSTDAMALPIFARQTGQNCMACHAGGQFPELTPYGRMFKMTGYTLGARTVPFSVMGVADFARVRDTSKSDNPQDDFQKNGVMAIGGGSLFIAGKVTDNIGGFIQDTYNNYSAKSTTGNFAATGQTGDGKFLGHSSADYIDIRYADRFVDAARDLVFGVSLNNRPSGTDPSSAAPAWMQYVPATSVTSRSFNDAGAGYPGIPSNVAGVNAYAFWNRMIYAELGIYQTANRWKSFLTSGNLDGATPKLKGTAPYWRLALSHEWGPHNILVGTTGMIAHYYDNSSDTSDSTTANRVKNIGLDAQYQYLLDPHTITAQFSYMKQTTDLSPNAVLGLAPPATYTQADGVTPLAPGNASNTVNTLRAKLSYVYQAKYGGSLSYFNRTGTTDTAAMTSGYDPACGALVGQPAAICTLSSTRVTGNLSGNPATNGFTYEAFWMPVQYMRVGVQYTMYNKYNGASTNYDGFGRNAKDNNTLYFYVWGAY